MKKQVKSESFFQVERTIAVAVRGRKKISKHQSSVQKQLLKQDKFERKQQKRRDKHKGH